MAEPSHLSRRVQRTSRALGRGMLQDWDWGRGSWGSQSWGEAMEHIKDNGIPEAYSRKQKTLSKEEKIINKQGKD